MRLAAMMLRRLMLWALRRLAKPLVPFAAFLVLVYVVVGREEGWESPGVSSPGEQSGHGESWQAPSRLETDPFARVSCVLGPRGPCQRYVAFAVGYQAWLAQARDARASARLTPEMVAALAGAERRARRAVRRRAFDEALQELHTARSTAEAQLARTELLIDAQDSAPTDASAPAGTGHSEVERDR